MKFYGVLCDIFTSKVYPWDMKWLEESMVDEKTTTWLGGVSRWSRWENNSSMVGIVRLHKIWSGSESRWGGSPTIVIPIYNLCLCSCCLLTFVLIGIKVPNSSMTACILPKYVGILDSYVFKMITLNITS